MDDELSLEELLRGMSDEEVTAFRSAAAAALQGAAEQVRQRSRDETYSAEQGQLETEFRAELQRRGIQRGNLVGYSRLESEFAARGRGGGLTHTERQARQPQQPAPRTPEEEEDYSDLRARYRAAMRSASGIPERTRINQKFRDLGLEDI